MKRVLDAIVALVVRCCDPEEVLLFGSHAKGYADRHSDIDLLVVGQFRQSPYLRADEVKDLLRRFPLAIDVHLVTREELAGGGGPLPREFLRTIQCGAVTLYKRCERHDFPSSHSRNAVV